MKRLADRRTILLAAGTAAFAAVAGPTSAQSTEITGTIEFEGGASIPKGEVWIYIDDPSIQGDERPRDAEKRTPSDGESRALDFSLSSPVDSTSAPGAQIVARLERADGWLLARGSAPLGTGSPVRIVLHTVMY